MAHGKSLTNEYNVGRKHGLRDRQRQLRLSEQISTGNRRLRRMSLVRDVGEQIVLRAYRIRQIRPVTVYRLCMADLIDALVGSGLVVVHDVMACILG